MIRYIIFLILILVMCLSSTSCNRVDESGTDNPGTEMSAVPDPSDEEAVADNQADEEDLDTFREPEVPFRTYTEEELATFSELLGVPAAEARQKLLDEGAVLNSDYLIDYIEKGRTVMVVRMISSGMDLNDPASNGKRPLAETVLKNDPYLMELMIEHGADPTLGDDPAMGTGRSLLHYAAKMDNAELVQRLINLGVEPDVTDVNDQTPLDVAATYGETEAMRVLLENGADPMRVDKGGSVPILLAAGYGNLEAARLLIQNGADLNYRHERGWTPLLLAVYYDFEDVAVFLLDNGADMQVKHESGLGVSEIAANNGSAGMLRRMIDAGARVDRTMQFDGRNIIHLCALSGLGSFIEELAGRGIDPAATDKDGRTPLDLAAEAGDEEAMEILSRLTGVDPPPNTTAEGDGAETAGADESTRTQESDVTENN